MSRATEAVYIPITALGYDYQWCMVINRAIRSLGNLIC